MELQRQDVTCARDQRYWQYCTVQVQVPLKGTVTAKHMGVTNDKGTSEFEFVRDFL